MKKTFTALLCTVMFSSLSATAKETNIQELEAPVPVVDESEQSYQNMLHKKFAEIDANGDGIVSPEEYKAYNDKIEQRRREIMDKAYLDMDTDKDGKVSEAEFLARLNRRREEIRNMIKGGIAVKDNVMQEEGALSPAPVPAD